MILRNVNTKTGVKIGAELIIPNGANKGGKFKVSKFVFPTSELPMGLVVGNPINESWQQLYPHVLDCEWAEDEVATDDNT